MEYKNFILVSKYKPAGDQPQAIEYLSKDSSDLVKNHGREVLKKVILELTN